MINQELLQKMFEYKNGELYWKTSPSNNIKKGSIAGTLINRGYLQVSIKNKRYLIHRLIFLIHHGHLPKIVDHIDGNRLNNRIENLREATSQQNNMNSKIPKTNTSGIKGVCWNKQNNKWKAQIRVNGKVKHIGCFDDLKLADLAIQEARNKYHKEFANNGQ